MICIKTKVTKEICEINDESKAIYHSNNSICIWVFKKRKAKNKIWTHLKNKTVLKEKNKKTQNPCKLIYMSG